MVVTTVIGYKFRGEPGQLMATLKYVASVETASN